MQCRLSHVLGKNQHQLVSKVLNVHPQKVRGILIDLMRLAGEFLIEKLYQT